jgi:aspartyl-tRNA(Asn)/glutamyl-tRNA(Gln) amidotransferase subunit B
MNDFGLVDPETIDPSVAKVVLHRSELPRAAYTGAIAASGDPGFDAEEWLKERVTSDESALEPVIDAVLAANPEQVETYRGGKEGVLGYLVGQVMRETQGKADPKAVNRLLREKLRG